MKDIMKVPMKDLFLEKRMEERALIKDLIEREIVKIKIRSKDSWIHIYVNDRFCDCFPKNLSRAEKSERIYNICNVANCFVS